MYVCMYQGLGLFTGKLPEALEPLAEFLDSKEAAATGLERALKQTRFFFVIARALKRAQFRGLKFEEERRGRF